MTDHLTMLKKFILPLFASLGLMMGTTASADPRAVQLIKNMYADILDDDLIGEDVETIRYTPQLRSLIGQLEEIGEKRQWEMCEWSYDHKTVPGNDFDTRLNQMKFSTLPNGRVRAQGVNFGERFYRDFEIICTANNCKINDIFDPTVTPNSYQQAIRKIIKNKNC